MQWLLALSYYIAVVSFGLLFSCVPCCYGCLRRTKDSRRCTKWTYAFTAVFIAWSVNACLWLFYSPLSVCSLKTVYSFPKETHRDVWEPFWCSRRCDKSSLVYAQSVTKLSEVVRVASHVSAVGGGHSSTELQCVDDGTIVVLSDDMCSFGEIIDDTISIGAGCSVERALRHLLLLGYQLKGFGAIAQQTIGGALSTSLHGQHPVSFSAHLVGLTALLANGSTMSLTHPDDKLNAWKGSMGRLGILLTATLRIYPLEFVECATRRENQSGLTDALLDPLLVGFEAKRLLKSEDYYVRRCYASNTSFTIGYDDKNSLWNGFIVDNLGIPLIMLFG